MEKEFFALIAMLIAITSCCLSAFYWKKVPALRKLPVPITMLSFTVYHFMGLNDKESFFALLLASFFIGLGLYFSVWIQCKSGDDRFF